MGCVNEVLAAVDDGCVVWPVFCLCLSELRVMLEPPALPALLGESVALRCVVWGGGKVENAVFFKDNKSVSNEMKDTYIITSATQDQTGKYSCRATYRYSHISPDAARQEGISDAQELKVIGKHYNNCLTSPLHLYTTTNIACTNKK